MTILVTGGAGYIGSHTAVELLQSGYDIVIVDNFCNSHPEVLNRIQSLTGKTPAPSNVGHANEHRTDQLLHQW